MVHYTFKISKVRKPVNSVALQATLISLVKKHVTYPLRFSYSFYENETEGFSSHSYAKPVLSLTTLSSY